jgi:flagellin-like hook-associated protein FlgL
MPDINLSKAVRSNLLSLQSTAAQMAKTQERLATGLKVNSALDNPTNFFTAASLNSRASDMANLLDSMSNGIKTIEAADNGLTSITKTVEAMQSSLRQARQDKSFKTASYSVDTALTAGNISFSGGAVGSTAVNVSLVKTEKTTAAAIATIGSGDNGKQFTVSNGTTATANITLATGDTVDTIVSKINAATATAGNGITATNENGKIKLTSVAGAAITVAEGTTTGGAALLGFGSDATVAKTTDELVSSVNSTASLKDKIRASNDNGKLRIENLSTTELTVGGVSALGTTDGVSTGASEIGGNTVRKNLVNQFNELRDQLDKFADDASFNGINLLRGDKLKLTFNETGTSTIDIQAKNEDGDPIAVNNASLGIEHVVDSDFDADTTLDAKLDVLGTALLKLRSLASSFGSNLSIVQNRTDFTKKMINTLETGAANLTLADTNEEAANLLALQTRQQLSSTALSMASQADQAVLRLF